MATSSSAASSHNIEEAFSPARRMIALIPGLLLLAAIGYAGSSSRQSIAGYTKSHHVTFPNIEYVLWAIVIGLVISNTVGIPRVFEPGVATYEFWLKAGIVLLGSRFLLGDLLHLGGISILLVVIAITLSLTFMHILGRAFNLNPKLTSLLAVGSSICGVSAIIAAKPAIDADDEDASYAIAAILALGAISLFTFPLIGHSLHLSDKAYGLWAGLAVDNTAEATAAGALYSDAAGKVAVLAKTTRNATDRLHRPRIRPLLVIARPGSYRSATKLLPVEQIPEIVLGFLLISLLATLGFFAKPQLTSLANLSRWAFLLTFAGVGLRTKIGELGKQGWRPFAVGAIGEVFIALITLGLVYGADRFLPL